MYKYEWDPETGGLVLNTSPLHMSSEPRPVYYRELEILGFDKECRWVIPQDDSRPIMWAEANKYWYRGRLVARTNGGSLFSKPKLEVIEAPEPEGIALQLVDIDGMVEKNKEIMGRLVDETIKKIYNTYVEFQDKVDVFYVAFSGGKDSVVTLDLVQRALPHNAFMVMFGDTGMEFSDTYILVDQIERYCNENDIDFIRARSRLSAHDSWRLLGHQRQLIDGVVQCIRHRLK